MEGNCFTISTVFYFTMENMDQEIGNELESTLVDASVEDVMILIEAVVQSTLQQIANNSDVHVDITSRAKSNAVYCKNEKVVRLKKKTVKRRLSEGKRYQGMWKVLQICYSLLKNKKQLNQRELYYMNADVV